jgi:hypothetical protein
MVLLEAAILRWFGTSTILLSYLMNWVHHNANLDRDPDFMDRQEAAALHMALSTGLVRFIIRLNLSCSWPGDRKLPSKAIDQWPPKLNLAAKNRCT